MPATLADLDAGRLAGARRVDLAADLERVPDGLLGLAESLEVLDLSGNRLAALPDWLPRLHRLRILFLSGNPLPVLPEVLGAMPALELVGARGCGVAEVPPASLPPRLRWLILTGNRLAALPDDLGRRPRLEKVGLAGNRLTVLPESLAGHPRLALLRIAANALPVLPSWLAALPALAWLGAGANPGVTDPPSPALSTLAWADLADAGELGAGASGVIRRMRHRDGRMVAVKRFRAGLTSDGLPASEEAAWCAAGAHPHLIGVTARVAGVPDGGDALAMDLLDDGWIRLGHPPSLESCSRDTFPGGTAFPPASAARIAAGIAAALAHLHGRGLVHGDLYAHNILVRADGTARLGDFGAAWAPPGDPRRWQRHEVLAYGHLLDDLLRHCPEPPPHLAALRDRCRDPDPAARPDLAACAALTARDGGGGR
ncbi:MAG: hypothetical protein RLZZ127_30 [Planctomycetota bacterium]|jgi:hypothetical protein